ncbi:MAG TPA: hypothetical protein VLA88_01480 [Candidatus Saccharimonadales bacterium]|nr:hypothetical protein [Candidatus Saccharimonadales bacterium]
MPGEQKPQAPAPVAPGGVPSKGDAPRLTGLKKRQQIELAGRYMFVWVAVAAIAVSFCIATGQYMFSKWDYNNKVLNAKYKASDTLTKNVSNANELKKEVDALLANPELASVKTDPNDTATKSILDALPTTLDPAALATSLQQAILNRSGITIENITVPSEVGGAAAAASPTTSSSSAATPQEAKFTFVVSGSYSQIRTMVHDLERTIRPIKITGVTMNGTDANLRATFDAVTYFQPAKSANAKQEVVK